MSEFRRRLMMAAAQGGTPTPPVPHDGQLEYIETDGISYINTSVLCNTSSTTNGFSIEMKVLIPSTDNNVKCVVGQFYPSQSNSNKIFQLGYRNNGELIFGWYWNYVPSDGVPTVPWSVTNEKPFIFRFDVKVRNFNFRVKEEVDSDFRVKSNTNANTASNDYYIRLFSAYDGQTSSWLTRAAAEGTRIYYCKIYNDNTYTNLVRDYVPYRLNDVVGVWDNVNQNFTGNQNPNGTFIGGPNIN